MKETRYQVIEWDERYWIVDEGTLPPEKKVTPNLIEGEVKIIVLNVNTVHLMITKHHLKLIGAEGLERRGRKGNLLILRLTPRLHFRLRLDVTLSCKISFSTSS